jgi:hypothetical protein
VSATQRAERDARRAMREEHWNRRVPLLDRDFDNLQEY